MSLEEVIPRETLGRIIDAWRARGATYVECRAELRRTLTIEIQDGTVRRIVYGESCGVAIRVLLNRRFHFRALSADALSVDAALRARPLPAKAWIEEVELADVPSVRDRVAVEEREPLLEVPVEEKLKLVRSAHERARGRYVKAVSTRYVEFVVEKLMVTSEGSEIWMRIPYALLRHEVTASREGRINASRDVYGVIGGFELLREDEILRMSDEVRERAVEGAVARRCPPGKHRVVLDGDLNHLLAHEALGHAAEADSLRLGSILREKLGKRIASSVVNIVDNGRFELNGIKGFGWIPYDDEAVPTERTVIIERGVLRCYMTNRETAHALGLKPTGNARAQDWMSAPIVRMRNTFIEPASKDVAMSKEELLQELRNGLLLKRARGGQVDDVRGVFTFGVQEAWLVRNGEPVERLASTSISGNILVVLKRIEAVSREFDPPQRAAGFCGKFNQLVPVGVTGPWILVREITVGG